MFGDKKTKAEKEDNKKEPVNQESVESGAQAAGSDLDISMKESEYNRLIKDAAEYKDKYLRLFAEFDNARKRMDREKMEFVKYANEGLLAEFLNILDDLERSMEAAKQKHEDYEAFLQGIEMVMAHIYEMLKKNNVKPIDVKGKKFDPHFHEPLMQEETESADEGTILDVFQKGYVFGDRVLRTAKVKVASVKTPNQVSEEPDSSQE